MDLAFVLNSSQKAVLSFACTFFTLSPHGPHKHVRAWLPGFLAAGSLLPPPPGYQCAALWHGSLPTQFGAQHGP